MRILLEGAQGTGKSTLIETLKRRVPGIKITPQLRPDFSITDKTKMQIKVIDDYIKQIEDNPNGVWDRGFLSGLAMTKFLTNDEKQLPDDTALKYYLSKKEMLSQAYDLIFILRPLDVNSVPDDNRRDTNVQNRDKIQNYIEDFAKDLTNVVYLKKGSPDDYVDQIMEAIQRNYYESASINGI